MTASISELSNLHALIATSLMNKIREGEATSADISAAIKFLKDNGIEATRDDAGIQDLINSLPDIIEEDQNSGVVDFEQYREATA